MCSHASAETDGCCSGTCGCASTQPAEMPRMARTLGVDGLLTGEARAVAAERCAGCEDRDACRDWLSVAAIRGAEHAPGFCRNAETFEALASEAPATI
jgi:hypothetical protein